MVGLAIQNGDLTDKDGGRRGRHWDAMMVLNPYPLVLSHVAGGKISYKWRSIALNQVHCPLPRLSMRGFLVFQGIVTGLVYRSDKWNKMINPPLKGVIVI